MENSCKKCSNCSTLERSAPLEFPGNQSKIEMNIAIFRYARTHMMDLKITIMS